MKSSTPLSFKTANNEIILPSTPHSNFNKRFSSNFHFMQLHDTTQGSSPPSNCSVIIQNITNRNATLPLGCIGYIEIPAIIEIPPTYQVQDVNSLINRFFYADHPTLSEPIPPQRSSSVSNIESSSSFEINNF